MNTTMWKQMRISAGLTVQEVADDLKVNRQTIYKYEKGTKPMPLKAQIYYLKARGLEIDLINAKYLEEVLRERIIFKVK